LTPNLNDSDSSEDLIPRLEDTQNNDTSNVDELLALCSGKFPGIIATIDIDLLSVINNMFYRL